MPLRLGRYEALKEIAKGGMATVFLGRALAEGGFERLVAIKLMHSQYADQPEFEAMFFDEARLAARIRHPNVVPTLDVMKAPEGMFLVMEYVEGPSLGAIIRELRKDDATLPLEITLRIFLDMLAGLHAAHELESSDGKPLNLVHRDVSPQNILIGSDGVTRITDFGVARAEVRSASTVSGEIKGKLAYMAAEQLMSEPVDARSDVYAAGIVLWETLVGRRAFHAKATGALLTKVIGGVKKNPRGENPEVPKAIDRVCMRAVRLSPDDRYPSAAAFGEALEEAAEGVGLPIADARAVSSFVTSLDSYRDTVVPSKLLQQEPTPILTRAVLEDLPNPASSPSMPSGSHSGTHGEAVLFSPRGRRKSRWPLAVGAVVSLLALAAGVVVAGRISQSGGAAAASAPTSTSSVSADPGSAGASAATASEPKGATADAVLVESSATPEAADAGVDAAVQDAASPKPVTRPWVQPGPRPGPRPTSANPEDFHPPGL